MATKQNRQCVSYSPTPAQIKKATERIQAGWSVKERAKRAGESEEVWTAPVVSVESLGGIELTVEPVPLHW